MLLEQPHGADPALMGCRIFSLSGILARASLPLLKAAGEFREGLRTPQLMLGQLLRCLRRFKGFGAP